MRKLNKKKIVIILIFIVLLFLCGKSMKLLLRRWNHHPTKMYGVLYDLEWEATKSYNPMLVAVREEQQKATTSKDDALKCLDIWIPWLQTLADSERVTAVCSQENDRYKELILEDDSTDYYELMQQENDKLSDGEFIEEISDSYPDDSIVEDPTEYIQESESEMEKNQEDERDSGRLPVYQYDLQKLNDYETLVKSFYIIDQNTAADKEDLDVTRFLQKNYTIPRDTEEPTILIYHTHSKEGYMDVPKEVGEGTVVELGEILAKKLESYGYNVLHDTTSFDEESRDYAYSNALPYIENLLKEHGSIKVVIDLHRDEMREDTHLVSNIEGKDCARFMFFNGMSRLRKSGKIAYLENPFLEDNLGFSFQLQLASNSYYPGLARKIYLKAYRYNLHLRAASVLIELGAQNNTWEEAKNACDPLAEVIDTVLSGEISLAD